MAGSKKTQGNSKRKAASKGRGRKTPARKTAKSATAKTGHKTRSKTTKATGAKRTPQRKVRKVAGKRPAARAGWPHSLRVLLGFCTRVAAVAFIGVVAGLGGLFWYGRDLPPVSNLAELRKQPRITVLDRSGTEIGVHGQDRGAPVRVAALPPHVIHAFIATEDRNFFHHVGVNPIAIVRALTVNVKKGGVAQGGSTITQQLVKNLVLSPEKTVKRKAQEVLLALKIESQFDKDEILSLYLNRVYFGNGAYGIEAASRRYFGKSPHHLTVGEAAMLAGLLKAPSKYSPKSNGAAARGRARVVLSAMVEAGFLTTAEAQHISEAGVASVVHEDRRVAYAVDHAVVEAKRLLGSFTEDVTVQTTIDAALIHHVISARERIAAADPLYTPQVQTAALVLEEDGAIRGLIGGNDYKESVYNRATQANRQPGSVFKPFVYLAALENGWWPEDEIEDAPIKIGTYEPTNYKDTYAGFVSINEAMRRSLNAAVINLQEEVGRDKVVATARRMGLRHVDDIGPALALGVMEATPLDIAQSFLPFSNGGVPATPYIVEQITDAQGARLYQRSALPTRLAEIDPPTLAAFDYMMRAVVHSGSGGRARISGHYAAGKTGTSQDSRDAWFAGYASGMVGVVWLGKDNDTPMDNGRAYMSGSGAPAQLWAAMMSAALEGRPARPPLPYTPRPAPPKNLFEHLANILGGGGDDDAMPTPAPEPDSLSQLIDEVSLYD